MRRLTILALAPAAAVIFAAPANAAPEVHVQAGFDGHYTRYAHIPVRVRVAKVDRLVRGTLEARAALWMPRVVLPVEIPGGGEKEFAMLVPPPSGRVEVTVTLRDRGGRRVAAGSAALDTSVDQELVGLLPGVIGSRPLPGTTPLSVDVGTARFVRVDGLHLETGPAGLRSLGTIGAAPDELARLGPSARAGLLGWIADGGRLLVDGDPGTKVAGLPDGWHPGPAGRAPAGRGEVVLTAGAMGAGKWGGLIEPTERVREVIEESGRPDDGLVQSLAASSGVSAPRMDRLMVPLLVYVLAIGPLLFVILRARRREELAWIIIPLAAIVFTAASYAWAVASRSGGRAAHATVLETSPAGSWALASVGTASAGGGELHVRFPRRWGGAFTGTSAASSQEGASVLLTAEGPEVVIPLNPGQFARAQAGGPADAGGGLRVSARAEGDRVAGTVTNATPFRLENAAVVVGKNVVTLGALPAGGERTWSTPAEPEHPHFWSVTDDLFPGTGRAGLVQPAATRLPYELWVKAAVLGDDMIQSGEAVALGVTKDFRLALSLNGSSRKVGGTTLVLGRGHVTRDGGPLGALTVRRELLRGPGGRGEPGSDFPEGFSEDNRLVLRYTIEGPMPPKVALRGPSGLSSLEVWRNGAWERVAGAEPQEGFPQLGAIPRARRAIPIPDGRPVPPDIRPVPPGPPFFRGQNGPEIDMTEYDLPFVERVMFVRVAQQRDLHTEWAFDLKEKA